MVQGAPSSFRDLARANVAAAELALVMPSAPQGSGPSEEEEAAAQHRQDMEVGCAACTIAWCVCRCCIVHGSKHLMVTGGITDYVSVVREQPILPRTSCLFQALRVLQQMSAAICCISPTCLPLMVQAAAMVHLLKAAAPGCQVVACLHSPSSALWLDPTGWLLAWQPEEGTCQVLPAAMCGQLLLPQVLDCTLCQVRLSRCSSQHVGPWPVCDDCLNLACNI
jgi:hypothetical protein